MLIRLSAMTPQADPTLHAGGPLVGNFASPTRSHLRCLRRPQSDLRLRGGRVTAPSYGERPLIRERRDVDTVQADATTRVTHMGVRVSIGA